MPKLYRYKPAENRTPVNDPVLGHLEYGKVYDNPECAHRDDFEEVKSKAKRPPRPKRATPIVPDRPKRTPAQAQTEAEERGNAAPVGSPENPIVTLDVTADAGTPDASDQPPSDKPADAGDTGRSNS